MCRIELGLLVALALLTTGCGESALLVGNGISMLVTCLLLWSTVTMNRRYPDGNDR